LWHKSAPPELRKAASAEANGDAWSLWVEHLASRRKPEPLARLCPTKGSPLAWWVPRSVRDDEAAGLRVEIERIARRKRLSAEEVRTLWEAWGEASAGSMAEPVFALTALAWAHALPRLAGVLEAPVWWEMLDRLMAAVAEAEALDVDETPWTHQMLCGELPLTLAYLFPEIKPARKLGEAVRQKVSEGVVELLDGAGLPSGEHLGLMRPLLACWTRCLLMGEHRKKGPLNAEAMTQYEWLVRQTLRLSRADGSHAFSDDPADGWPRELLAEVLRLGGDEDDAEIAAPLASKGRGKGKGKGKGKKKADLANAVHLPEASVESEWASVAALRASWAAASSRVTVAYPEDDFQIECETGGQVLFSGNWEFSVERDGESLVPESEWAQVCWTSDEDGDYLETEIDLSGGVQLQRHVFLAREDEIAVLADSIVCPEEAALRYRGMLPLWPTTRWEEADEHTDGLLWGRRRRARVLPLGLPEWKCDPRPLGALTCSDRGLQLEMTVRGRAVFAPLLVDLCAKRIGRPLTWRHLTVAESLQIQPPDVAVGYRVQLGREQWLLYRSLAPRGNRTLLGHNLSSDLLIGRFLDDGEVEPLVEVE
jgi:hypothetical protein